MSEVIDSITDSAIGDLGVALIIDGMTTLGHTTKRVLFVVGHMSMPVKTLATEALGIEAWTVEAL